MDTVNPETPAHVYLSPGLAARTSASMVDLDGGRVAFWTYEPLEETPDTRTILVVHGFRGDHHGLLRVADQLPDMRIIMPDLPGFGSSDAFAGDPHSVERYGQFITDFMASQGLGRDTVL
ncbi:MAG TPA: alpha/beta hydrolase, partial [Arthrobacter sp.]